MKSANRPKREPQRPAKGARAFPSLDAAKPAPGPRARPRMGISHRPARKVS